MDEVEVVLGGEEGDVGDGHDEREEREARAEERDHRPLPRHSAAHQVLEAHGDRHDAEDDLGRVGEAWRRREEDRGGRTTVFLP